MTGPYCIKSPNTHFLVLFWWFFEWFTFMVLLGAHLNPSPQAPFAPEGGEGDSKVRDARPDSPSRQIRAKIYHKYA